MKLVVQRVEYARVSVGGSVVGECQKGLMLLLGVAEGDTREDADALAKKLTGLRIFTDENDKMNLSIKDIGGEALVISNFTLLANVGELKINQTATKEEIFEALDFYRDAN